MEQMKQCICKHTQKTHTMQNCLACECQGYTEEVDGAEVPMELIPLETTEDALCEKCGESFDGHLEIVTFAGVHYGYGEIDSKKAAQVIHDLYVAEGWVYPKLKNGWV